MSQNIKKCVIVGAGELGGRKIDTKDAFLVIAADGGIKYLEEQNVSFDVFIGDCDSEIINGSEENRLSLFESPCDTPNKIEEIYPGKENAFKKNIEKIFLPKEKNDTDTVAAANFALKKGCNDFVFYAVTGGREDHTFANIQLVKYLVKKGCDAKIMAKDRVFTVLNKSSITFSGQEKGYISVFSLSGRSTVTLENLKYPLKSKTLTDDFPLGVSNEFLKGHKAKVISEKGYILVIYQDR